ncbi:DNA-binding transcriptional MerR regulator [Bacillus mesophilus]|uniref:DNA-binding anti-repressor SinI n=1 Tax=Bacillus mesophilus TaxID=1808955 RepID=A0A6M0QAE1_9BACI|nr:anti-repressor SinI family protein [Bacillus mesophilus]MBM7662661.1 DNA-binding transcriptional MerR regulator [Bacillus mesophilus]NEY73275.1 DNA-binding anti-repressor SinI [Bacillus mesophilus]
MITDLSKGLEKLDQEWIDLILAALDMGLSVLEIQSFLNEQTLDK